MLTKHLKTTVKVFFAAFLMIPLSGIHSFGFAQTKPEKSSELCDLIKDKEVDLAIELVQSCSHKRLRSGKCYALKLDICPNEIDTPLTNAIDYLIGADRVHIVKVLLDAGANPHIITLEHDTALIAAVFNRAEEIVDL
ncbi:MAG: hypothetical protein ABIQ95_04090, partial [Bdellovibrionia bacterium]